VIFSGLFTFPPLSALQVVYGILGFEEFIDGPRQQKTFLLQYLGNGAAYFIKQNERGFVFFHAQSLQD
jgi:hypothetical protein